jgi:hypothetical protein
MKAIIKYLLLPCIFFGGIQPGCYADKPHFEGQHTKTEAGNSLCNEKIVMHIDRETYVAGERVFFRVYLYDRGTRNLSHFSRIAYIILRDIYNNHIIRQNIMLSGGTGQGSLLLPDTLQSGRYQITAFTNWMRNFGEAHFSYTTLTIANRFDENPGFLQKSFLEEVDEEAIQESNSIISVKSDRNSYRSRDKVTLLLSNHGNSVADISVSVSEKTCEQSRLNLKSPVTAPVDPGPKGIPEPDHKTSGNCKYLSENTGYIISGSVEHLNSPSGVVVSLSSPDSLANLLYSYTNSSGKYFFQLDRSYYNKELFVGILDWSGNPLSSIIMDDKYSLQDPVLVDAPGITGELRQFIAKSQIIASIRKAYEQKSDINEDAAPTEGMDKRVYYKPDYKIITSDYQPLHSFEEITRETLPTVRLKKTGNDIDFEVLNLENKVFMKHPALFINGMPVSNLDPIMNFGYDRIKWIEVVCHKRYYGSLELNGILAVFTTPDVKTEDLTGMRSHITESVTFQKPSLYNPPDFASPSQKRSRNPDFRQLLYWNPGLLVQGGKTLTIEFNTSDNTGSYVIQIRGVTSDGVKISNNETFLVQ